VICNYDKEEILMYWYHEYERNDHWLNDNDSNYYYCDEWWY